MRSGTCASQSGSLRTRHGFGPKPASHPIPVSTQASIVAHPSQYFAPPRPTPRAHPGSRRLAPRPPDHGCQPARANACVRPRRKNDHRSVHAADRSGRRASSPHGSVRPVPARGHEGFREGRWSRSWRALVVVRRHHARALRAHGVSPDDRGASGRGLSDTATCECGEAPRPEAATPPIGCVPLLQYPKRLARSAMRRQFVGPPNRRLP